MSVYRTIGPLVFFFHDTAHSTILGDCERYIIFFSEDKPVKQKKKEHSKQKGTEQNKVD